ncbi:asparagine synthase [Acrasis kona]|uniref:Asparagine synthase n=1 Tax=Acrasis kona TaxID=1008807 RepID=A0AAW2ZL68_9EUKA
MCGISVVVSLDESSKKTKSEINKELDASLDLIKHRGPDSRGIWISEDGRVSLGHCRLAINDLSPEGHQPLPDTDEEIYVVVNGEIYDHDRIREDLKTSHGYKFRGHSDSEVVVALYKIHGLTFLSELRGEFSFCLYDVKNQFFMAARDRYGIKPLFWTQVDGRLLIASETKAFLALGWKPEWDVRSIADAGWNHDQRTLFKGVNKLRPGHYLISTSFGPLESTCYWDLEYPDKNKVEKRTQQEMIEGVRNLLLESVRLRLRADVPVGIYLSGGIDSSVIAGMVAHLVKEQGVKIGSKDAAERICCFSIAFDDSEFDESAISNRTAEWLDVKFVKKLMNEEELAKNFKEATYHIEHHNMDLNFIGKYALSQVTYEHGYRVVLTGEGSDEHFAGYPLYLPDFLREEDKSWPQLTCGQDRNKLYADAEASISNYYTSVGADGSNRLPCKASRQLNNISTPASMAAFQFSAFDPWVKEVYGTCLPLDTISNNIDGRTKVLMQEKWHPLHSAMYSWTKGHLANIFLSCLGDRVEMAHSVEARPPFLDHKLTEYVNNLPPSLKVHYNPETKKFTEKWILREAAKPFITDEIYSRAKHPYSAPVMWPEGGPLHKLFEELLTKENVDQLGFLDWSKVKNYVDDAFLNKNFKSFRQCVIVAQWIVLGQRFGVKRAH